MHANGLLGSGHKNRAIDQLLKRLMIVIKVRGALNVEFCLC